MEKYFFLQKTGEDEHPYIAVCRDREETAYHRYVIASLTKEELIDIYNELDEYLKNLEKAQ